MESAWAPLVWVALLSVPLFLLTRWLSLHLQGLGLLFSGNDQIALLLHYLVLLPGVLLHEASHLLAARLVGVRIRSVSLRPVARRGGSIRMGAVTVAQSDPLRESWIGLAPLITGVAGILLLARWQFGIESPPALTVEGVLSTLSASLQAPDALVGLYVIFSLSNSMWPSESDRRQWGVLLLVVALAVSSAYVVGLFTPIPSELARGVTAAAEYLAFAFALSVAVDVPVALAIVGFEKVGERILGRRVEY